RRVRPGICALDVCQQLVHERPVTVNAVLADRHSLDQFVGEIGAEVVAPVVIVQDNAAFTHGDCYSRYALLMWPRCQRWQIRQPSPISTIARLACSAARVASCNDGGCRVRSAGKLAKPDGACPVTICEDGATQLACAEAGSRNWLNQLLQRIWPAVLRR